MALAVALFCILSIPAAHAQETSVMVEEYSESDVSEERSLLNADVGGGESALPGVNIKEFTDNIDKLFAEQAFGEADELLREKSAEYPDMKRLKLLQATSLAHQKKWNGFFDKVREMSSLAAFNSEEEELIRRETEHWFAAIYEEGILLARDGRYEEALALLDRLAKFDYRAQAWQFDKIVIATWQGKYTEAIEEFERLSPSQEVPEYLLAAMVDAYRSVGKERELLAVYDRILEREPTHEQYRLSASRTALSLGDIAQAKEHARELIEQHPDNVEYLLQMAEVYVRDDNYLTVWELINRIPEEKAAEHMERIKGLLASLTDVQVTVLMNDVMKADIGQDLTTPQILLLLRHYNRADTDFGDYAFLSPRVDRMFPESPLDIQLELAALVLKNGLVNKAVRYYTSILQRFPDNFEAHYALADIFYNGHEDEKALEHIETALQKRPDHYDALFLKGKILDKMGKYWESVRNYEQILRYYSDNKAAENLKYRALMDMGAATLVTEASADKAKNVDEVIAVRAQGDRAMQQINWEEPKPALETLEKVIEDYEEKPLPPAGEPASASDDGKDIEKENYLRARWDRVLALRRVANMEEIIKEYVKAKEEGMTIPFWVSEAAGDAYLYAEKPETALALYEDVLAEKPKSLNARFAKYYALLELERYGEATDLLEELDHETPKDTTERGVINDNWKKADIAESKAWLLMYQDRLKEAEEYLKKIQNIAPANTNLRTAQAQNHLWRGWPRQSLEDFRMVQTMDPRHVNGNIGYAQALNANRLKKEARTQIDSVLAKEPHNKHAQKVKRLFEVEDMTQLTVDAQYLEEFPGEDEYQFTVRLDQPLSAQHTLWGYWLRRETTDIAGNDITGRVYAGDQWQPNNTWQLTGGLSFDYEGDNDTGYLADIVFTPDDFWRFGAGYETEIISIPLRTRAEGVSANEFSLSSAFRLSEEFNTAFDFSYADFTDGNENSNYLWSTDTALTTAAHWKTRLGTQFSYSSFSTQDVSYFSPEQVYTFYAIPMVEHVWFQRYEKGITDRLFFGVGGNWQKGFGGRDVQFIRYEQDYKFSETKHWFIGVRYDLRQYDGDDVNSLNFYTTLKLNF